MTTTDRDTNEPADIDPQTLRNSLAWGEFVNQFVGAENVPTPIPPADVCPTRLTPERESEIRDSAERFKVLCPEWSDPAIKYGYGQHSCLLLVEIDTLRAERDKLAAFPRACPWYFERIIKRAICLVLPNRAFSQTGVGVATDHAAALLW